MPVKIKQPGEPMVLFACFFFGQPLHVKENKDKVCKVAAYTYPVKAYS